MPEAAKPIPEIESPCIGVCTVDTNGVCMGCFRTTAEIASWLSYSPARRGEIIAELPERALRYFDD